MELIKQYLRSLHQFATLFCLLKCQPRPPLIFLLTVSHFFLLVFSRFACIFGGNSNSCYWLCLCYTVHVHILKGSKYISSVTPEKVTLNVVIRAKLIHTPSLHVKYMPSLWNFRIYECATNNNYIFLSNFGEREKAVNGWIFLPQQKGEPEQNWKFSHHLRSQSTDAMIDSLNQHCNRKGNHNSNLHLKHRI